MQNRKILIVDDNPTNLKLEMVLLKSQGFDVFTAEDAETALKTLSTINPHLILMDIQLPGMDGLELTRLLKKDPDKSRIIIVAVTSYAMKGDEKKALEAGCDAYISKPIDIQSFSKKIAELLEKVK